MCAARTLRTALVTLCAGAVVSATSHASGAGPLGGGAAVVLEPAPAATEPRPQRRVVYSCPGGGHVVHSDRPCGPGPQIREMPVAAAGSSPSTAPAAPKASTRPARLPARSPAATRPGPDPQAQRCERLREAVAALDQHMRSGYSAREAARLWQRWRDAKERLRQARC